MTEQTQQTHSCHLSCPVSSPDEAHRVLYVRVAVPDAAMAKGPAETIKVAAVKARDALRKSNVPEWLRADADWIIGDALADLHSPGTFDCVAHAQSCDGCGSGVTSVEYFRPEAVIA